jgi:hypothetical protein
MKIIATLIICVFSFQNIYSQDTIWIISDGEIGNIKIGDSIKNYNYPLINSFKYIGDGYRIYENTYQIMDSCLITVGLNYYINDTNIISYLQTSCEKCQLQNGIRPGIDIKKALTSDSDLSFGVGYGQELSYLKFFKNSYLKLKIDNDTEYKYFQENNKELQSKILQNGFITTIELMKLNN